MSEFTENMEKSEEVIQTEQAEKAEKTEKPRTLSSVRRELKKLEKSREQKKKQIKSLTEEMKAENVKIKELEAVYDELYHEDLQKQISNAWFKKGGLTGEQIEKMLKLSKQIKDKIDILDVDTVVQAINTAYEQKQSDQFSDRKQPDEENPVQITDKNTEENLMQPESKSVISVHIPEFNKTGTVVK